MKPQQITTLEQLFIARENKKSVHVPKSHCWGVRPAAFMMNQPGEILLRLFKTGMFVYQKPEKPNGWKRPASTRYVLAGNHPILSRFDRTVFSWRDAQLLRSSMIQLGYEITIDPPNPQPARK